MVLAEGQKKKRKKEAIYFAPKQTFHFWILYPIFIVTFHQIFKRNVILKQKNVVALFGKCGNNTSTYLNMFISVHPKQPAKLDINL